MPKSLLVIEDESLLRGELMRRYEQQDWSVASVHSLAEAREALFEKGLEPLVVISDMNLPDGNALDLLEEVRSGSAGGEWIILTGYGTIPDSVRALRLGAFDFLEKPCDSGRLDLAVAGAARAGQAQLRLLDQSNDARRRHAVDSFVGSSTASQGVRDLIEKLARAPYSAVVVTGETGTGKGQAARILHYNGLRGSGPLVEVNCAALPDELLESELFGHEPGAFTGASGRLRGLLEQADGGALFLDEISEMSLRLQAKVLTALDDQRFRRLGGEKEIRVDVQVIAASNRELEECVRAGNFREDLYYRLSVLRLHIPALREREGDLEELVPLFIAQYNAKAGRRVRVVPEEAWAALRAYPWPGNVRELRNAIERCVLLAEGEIFPTRWLGLPRDRPSSTAGADAAVDVRLPLDGTMSLDDMERAILNSALERANGNVSAAARLLGVTRQTLRYRLEKHGLQEEA